MHGWAASNLLLPFLPLSPFLRSRLSLLSINHLRTQPSTLRTELHQLRQQHSLTTFQWNLAIRARIDAGLFPSSLSLVSSMMESGARPDHFTLPLVARAISKVEGRAAADLGSAVHALGIRLGFSGDVYFCNSMMELYSLCNEVFNARNIFDEMRDRDVVSWTTNISACIRSGDLHEASGLFFDMRVSGVDPNSVTLVVMLRAFGGKQLHALVIKGGFLGYQLVHNSILTAYGKMDCFIELEKLFHMVERSIISWNILISAYFSAGELFRVVHCFRIMVTEFDPSLESLTLVISALAKPQDFSKGQQIHCHALKSGKFDIILQASLVDFYAKCADLSSCFSLFEDSETENRDIPWVAMMWAFVQNGKFTQAIDLHHKMLSFGFEPTVDALSCLITACSNLGALLFGKAVHSYLIRRLLSADFKMETFGTSLLSMYAKCGILPLAWRCFKNMECRDTVAWSAMIEAFAIHGIGLKALELFNQMIEKGTKPNSTTFLSLLSCCSHSGLLSEGCQLFSLMTQKFSIKPELSHYTCMVDLLARAGKLIEALNLIHSMDMRPDGRIWGALLASCRVHQNLNIGSYAAQRVFKLEPENMGYRIVSSSIHVNPSVEAEQIWKFMDEMEFKGRPGWSCFEEKGGFSMFVAGDYSHVQMQEIYQVLSCLGKNMEESCYL